MAMGSGCIRDWRGKLSEMAGLSSKHRLVLRYGFTFDDYVFRIL